MVTDSPLLFGCKLRRVKLDVCTLVFVFGRLTSSSPSFIGISRLRHRPRRGLRPPSPPHLPLLCGAGQRQATYLDLVTPSRVNGRRRRMSFRLPSSFARVARTDAGPRSGPRSSRARDITTCLCASAGALLLLAHLLPAFLLTKMQYEYTSQTELPNAPIEIFFTGLLRM